MMTTGDWRLATGDQGFWRGSTFIIKTRCRGDIQRGEVNKSRGIMAASARDYVWVSMVNGSASAGGASPYIKKKSSRRTSSTSPVVSLPESTSSASPSLTAFISFPSPPEDLSQPPVPSPLPHPPLLRSNVSFPSTALRSPLGAGMRFTAPSSFSSSTLFSHSSGFLPPARTSSYRGSPSSSSEFASSPSSTASASPSFSSLSSVSSPGATSPEQTSTAISLASAIPASASSVSAPSNGGSLSLSFRNPSSLTYSGFMSALESPFFSPGTPNSVTPSFLTPPSSSFSSSAIHTPPGRSNNPAALLGTSSPKSGFSFSEYCTPSSSFPVRGWVPLESPDLSYFQTTASPSTNFPWQLMSPASAGRARSCDVFISLYGKCPALLRFAKWMRAELEMQGVACFSADRSNFSDSRSHDITRRIMNSVTFGVVIISKSVFRSRWAMEELRTFLDRQNLVPVFFDLAPSDISVRDIVERRGRIWEQHGGKLWTLYNGDEAEWREVVEGVLRVEDWQLEAHDGNWRDCLRKAVTLFGARLGRKSISEREAVRVERIDADEFPFPQNAAFTGRARELRRLEEILSPSMDYLEQDLIERARKGEASRVSNSGSSSANRRLEDARGVRGREPGPESASASEIRIDREAYPAQEPTIGRYIHRGTEMQRRSDTSQNIESSAYRSGCACITGVPGIGKTELALEYAYRNAKKYRMIIWLSAENRYLRQNYLNLSTSLGIHPAGPETPAVHHRGRVRSQSEQEIVAYQRIRQEMSRDLPYLLIIDHLESERGWWDGKGISELLPSPGGASHVIITTRLPRVMQIKCMDLSTLSGTEAINLMRGGRHLSAAELEALRDIDDKLARLTLGLAIVRRLLDSLHVMPSELLDLMAKTEVITDMRSREDMVLRISPYLPRLLNVCFSLLENTSGPVNLASKMALVAGWFAANPIVLEHLTLAASIYEEKLPLCVCLGNCMYSAFWCCMASRSRRRVGDAAYLLIQCGIARRTTKEGYIYFSEAVRVFLRRKGGSHAAKAVIQAVGKSEVLTSHLEQL
ncbi:hypothetical protein R1sor_006481 [Riccia sorocarpa]|uniref:TIR domain-containing protein n=1 Tax=Riccia sorocarpa TaxID=122646 RepID=A0ABD3HRD1_9MARC